MKSKKTLFSLVMLVVFMVFGWLLISSSEEKPDTVDSQQNMKTVEFCGKAYQIKPVVLFGVDMISRIAEIATEKPETLVCKNIEANPNYPATQLSIEVLNIPQDASGIYDYLRIDSLQFSFNPNTEEIFIHSGFDGTPFLFGSFR